MSDPYADLARTIARALRWADKAITAALIALTIVTYTVGFGLCLWVIVDALWRAVQ